MLTENSRIFTFGCSFTEFPWPTWADIIINHAESEVPGVVGENWGRCGAGNTFIASRIWECHAKNKLTSDDYVFICWTSVFREDRHLNGNWITNGELLNANDDFTAEYILKYNSDVNSRFNVLKDCALIMSTHLALKQLGVNVIHFSMIGLTYDEGKPWVGAYDESVDGLTPDDVVNTYDIKFDGQPMMSVLNLKDQGPVAGKTRYKAHWPNRKPHVEWHPTPAEHLTYLTKEINHQVDFLHDGINDAGKKLVIKYMAIINSFNKKPIPLEREILKWGPKVITEKW